MASLTDRRKREIEMLYRRMKEKPSKVFLNIFLDDIILNEDPTLSRYIFELVKQTEGIESYNYSEGTNYITATAQWNGI